MFRTNPILLSDLLNNVEAGKIQLPDFQRGWVWDDGRIRGLLASISRGFPVGAIMTLSAGADIKFRTRPIEGVSENGISSPESFLLDGQQRLTTLYQALRHLEAVNTSDSKRQKVKRWYFVDMMKALDENADREDDAILSVPESKQETSDFGRVVVRDLSTPELEYQQHMMPTESLMNPMEWMLGYLSYWGSSQEPHPLGDAVSFFRRFSDEVLTQFANYQLPVIDLGSQTPKEAVCTVFEKVNTGGVPLNVFELATASFAADAESFSLRDDWDARRKRMNTSSGVLQGIAGDQFLQAVALLKTQEDRRIALQRGTPVTQAPAVACKKKDILGLELDDYLRWADRVEAGFMDGAKFLRNQFVFGKRNVPYNTQLVPLAALHVELGSELESAVAKDRLAHWYWSGVFGEIYGGTTETQFALDLVEVAAYVRSGQTPRLVSEASFVPERLISLRSRLSAAYKGVMALQMKNGAKDWRTGEPLSVATYDEEHIDIHHIFPVAWCRRPQNGVPQGLYDSIINKTPIDAKTNRIIGGDAPSRYLPRLAKDMGGDEALSGVLSSHWLDKSQLDDDKFAESFLTRGEFMLKLIGDAMGRDLGNGRSVFLEALDKAGFQDSFLEEEEEPDEIGEADFMETDTLAA
ncbi:MAG: DUF262 domain-containing protein [Chloroflexota bacterium]|nr:DUF262 domain-containing protein [Chloroflexota bacterium]